MEYRRRKPCCYSELNTYGTEYKDIQWSPVRNSNIPSLFESFEVNDRPNCTDSYSNPSDYGMKMGLEYQQTWRCDNTPNCNRKKVKAMEGVF